MFCCNDCQSKEDYNFIEVDNDYVLTSINKIFAVSLPNKRAFY